MPDRCVHSIYTHVITKQISRRELFVVFNFSGHGTTLHTHTHTYTAIIAQIPRYREEIKKKYAREMKRNYKTEESARARDQNG